MDNVFSNFYDACRSPHKLKIKGLEIFSKLLWKTKYISAARAHTFESYSWKYFNIKYFWSANEIIPTLSTIPTISKTEHRHFPKFEKINSFKIIVMFVGISSKRVNLSGARIIEKLKLSNKYLQYYGFHFFTPVDRNHRRNNKRE